MSKTSALQSLNFKSSVPISNIIIIGTPFFFLITIYFYKEINVIGLVFNFFLGITIFYMMFARFGCNVLIKDYTLRVIYLMPWRKILVVNLHDYKYLSYGRSFYSFSLNHQLGYFPLFRICYDVLILTNEDEKVEMKINTMMFGFTKMISFLKDKVGLKEIDSDLSKESIW